MCDINLENSSSIASSSSLNDESFLENVLIIKEQNSHFSMARLAKEVGLTRKNLCALLKPKGEWSPKIRDHYETAFCQKNYPSKKAVAFFKQHAELRTNGIPRCEVCGIEEWFGTPFVNIAEKDHIDGNKQNNTHENFRVLCPNCHSHTTTRFSLIKDTHPSKNEVSLTKKNLITCEADVLISDNMKKAHRMIHGLNRKSPNYAKPLEDILEGKYPEYKTGALVNRMLGAGKRKHECECCGLTEWRGISILLFLQGHHKDGNPHNHRNENFEILCPNCHATRHTFQTVENPEFVGKKTTYISANASPYKKDSDLVQKVEKILNDPNRPKAIKHCAREIGISYKVFRKIVQKLYPELWQPLFTGVAKEKN